MEDENQINEGGAKQWLQDNLRIIISVLIVLVIALGIYSYSKKTTISTDDQTQVSEQATTGDSQSAPTTDVQKPSDTKTVKETPAPSQETDQSFIETAVKGDSSTKLARRALANYLEKNPDSALTAEHKIYIEDFLRKNVTKKKVSVGVSQEFSKSTIQNAITKSKTLSDKQLKNLHKYAVRVPSLT